MVIFAFFASNLCSPLQVKEGGKKGVREREREVYGLESLSGGT